MRQLARRTAAPKPTPGRPIDDIPAGIHNSVVALAPEIRHNKGKVNEAVGRHWESHTAAANPFETVGT